MIDLREYMPELQRPLFSVIALKEQHGRPGNSSYQLNHRCDWMHVLPVLSLLHRIRDQEGYDDGHADFHSVHLPSCP
jgi:hypothetical protein